MESERVYFTCGRCKDFIYTGGKCRCREEFHINPRENDFYMQQFLEVIRILPYINVPTPSQSTLLSYGAVLESDDPNAFRLRNGERKQCSFILKYFYNGVEIQMTKSWYPYQNVDHEVAKSEASNSGLDNVDTSSENYTVGVRLLADWNGSFEGSVLEIVGWGLDWNHILMAADSKKLRLEWHFYSLFRCRPMKCYSCDGSVVGESGECRCEESSLIHKEDERLMQRFKNSFLRVLETCKNTSMWDPAIAVGEDCGHDGNPLVGHLVYYRNGVGISFVNFEIANDIEGQSEGDEVALQLSESGHPETNADSAAYHVACLSTETEPQENISGRTPYLIHVRCLFTTETLDEGMTIEIMGENLEWDVMSEDVRNNVAKLSWRFYNPQNLLPWTHGFFEEGYNVEDYTMEQHDNDDEGEDEINVFGLASADAIEALVSIRGRDGGEPELCSICLEAILAIQSGKQLRCGHIYHEDCILLWLSIKNTCPNCNYMFPTNAD